jgi:GrpB-like predicted nucleotidyltransferase (UPF0157 family)
MARGGSDKAGIDAGAVVDYDPAWPQLFAALGRDFRAALQGVALRIDHIGSTAVPGLAAKPIIDIQISVASFEPLSSFRDPIESCGFLWRADNDERTKRYFRERPGLRRTHVHVRRAGSFSEQLSLLHRDFLRAHPAHAREYAEAKRSVAHLLRTDRRAYVEAKSPLVWNTVSRADAWAQKTGWEPGRSDA